MRPFDWKEIVKFCENEGCSFDRQEGDHYIMTKKGLARPIVIPTKKDLREDIVFGLGRTLGLTSKEVRERLDPSSIKKKKKKKKGKKKTK